MSEQDQPTPRADLPLRVAGLDLIESALQEEGFPMAKDGLYYAIGDYLLQAPDGEHIAVRDLLDVVDRDHFVSPAETLAALQTALARLPAAQGELGLERSTTGGAAAQASMIEAGDIEVRDLETEEGGAAGGGETSSMRAPAAQGYRPAGKLTGKVAIITGGDSGIGRAVAVLYALEGADVGIIYHSHDEDAARTRRAVEEAGRRCAVRKGDVGEPEFCRRAVRGLVEELGRLDVLVSNAAHQHSRARPEDIDEEQWRYTFRTNIDGYFFMVQSALPFMGAGGAIIATGSETGLSGSGHLLDYSATKGAIHTLTRSLAKSLVGRGIRVNCVAPGPVWTPLNPADPGQTAESLAGFGSGTDMGRAAQPDEIAPAYVFLASHADSSFVTGQVLAELGGASA